MGDLSDLARRDHAARLDRAIDHVTRHLDRDLSLDEVARVAGFSPFHFHRLFRARVGETLHGFVKRTRLERALYLLAHRDDVSMTEVALSVGFASSSDFSRAFKARYGVPPRRFELDEHRALNRAHLVEHVPSPPPELPAPPRVRLRELPPRQVAYVRALDPYRTQAVATAVERLVGWATRRGVERGQWLGYQWEDPELVPLERCRYDVGLEVDAAPLDGEVSLTTFPAMLVAEVDLEGTAELELAILDWLYGTWLPASPYAPAHHPCFEAWNGLPFAHGTTHFSLRIQLPLVDRSIPL